MRLIRSQTGFTLIEMLIVLSIIGIIVGVLMTAFLDARANARDKERVSDLTQIEFAINGYIEINKAFPDFASGVRVGQDTPFDALIDQYWDSDIADPLNDDIYHYVYSSNFSCNGGTYIAVLANNLEQNEDGNIETVCGGSDTYTNAYVVLIEGPLTGGISGGNVNVNDQGDWWADEDNQAWRDAWFAELEPEAEPEE